MEEVLRELTEFELDAVAGGNPFSQNGTAVSKSYENHNLGQIKVKLTLTGAASAKVTIFYCQTI